MTVLRDKFSDTTGTPVGQLSKLVDVWERPFSADGYCCCKAEVIEHVPLHKMASTAGPADEKITLKLWTNDGAKDSGVLKPLYPVVHADSIWADYPSTVQLVDTTVPGPRFGFVWLSPSYLAGGLEDFIVPDIHKEPLLAGDALRAALRALVREDGGVERLRGWLKDLDIEMVFHGPGGRHG